MYDSIISRLAADLSLSLCVLQRSFQTDEPISMSFFLFESWFNGEGSYGSGLMNNLVRIVLEVKKKRKPITAYADFK